MIAARMLDRGVFELYTLLHFADCSIFIDLFLANQSGRNWPDYEEYDVK